MLRVDGWKLYDKMAGTGIYKDEDDILDPKKPYHWTLGTEQELFRKAAEGNRKLLDIGCGTGRSSLFLAEEIEEITGIDMAPGMLVIASRKAKRKGIKNVAFSVENAEKLSFPVERFDCVFFCGSLATMRNPDKALKEAYRVLMPGGIIALIELNWEKAMNDDPIGERFFYKKDEDIYLLYTERFIYASKEIIFRGKVKKGIAMEKELKEQFKKTGKPRLEVKEKCKDLIPFLENIRYDETIQFTPKEFSETLKKAGFYYISIKGYSFLYKMLESQNLIKEMSPHMKKTL